MGRTRGALGATQHQEEGIGRKRRKENKREEDSGEKGSQEKERREKRKGTEGYREEEHMGRLGKAEDRSGGGMKRREGWEAEEKGEEQREKRGGRRRKGRGREEEGMDGTGGVHPTGTRGLQVPSTSQLHLEASCSSHPQDALLQLDTKFPEPCPAAVQALNTTDDMAGKHRVCPVRSQLHS